MIKVLLSEIESRRVKSLWLLIKALPSREEPDISLSIVNSKPRFFTHALRTHTYTHTYYICMYVWLYVNDNSQIRNDECYITGPYLYYRYDYIWYPIGQIILTSSISGRNACLSEEVTFTCTAQGNAHFWRSEAFGETAMHYTSAPSPGEFTIEIVSYDRSQNCLVSSLSFCATASRNGTTVMCTSRDRSSSQSLSLHIISSEFLDTFYLWVAS